MEKKAEFTDDHGFAISLTEEKVYVTAVGSQETFALRSVNGIGTYDDVEKYAEELKKAEQEYKSNRVVFIFLVLVAIITGIFCFTEDFLAFGGVCILVGVGVGVWVLNQKEPKDTVKMDSYFRIMLSGGDRTFKFNKQASNASDIASFINAVEDTLTAYKD